MVASITERSEQSEGYRTSASAEDSIGRWRRDLSPAIARAAEQAFAPALAEFGYQA
jgi:hypothetical protein